MSTKRRLLWVGDACVSSGFARATHQTLNTLRETWDVFVLGLNYRGDPHEYPYPVWPCFSGDPFGYYRVKELAERIGPAVIVIQQDPWNFQQYLQFTGNVPVVGAVAVDGKCCRGTELNGLAHAIFWTKFGQEEAKAGGYTGPSSVIPLGVDLTTYHPQDSGPLRERMGINKALEARGLPQDSFIVGYVGRNQQRKRLDLTIQYFADWVNIRKVEDACLWLHVAPTGDDAVDLNLLGRYYGISDRLMIPTVPIGHGVSEDQMARVYSMFDIFFTTTLGEGWGLPIMEAMACGTPCLVPSWSGLADWASAAVRVPCTSTSCHPPAGISSIGGVMDRAGAINHLDTMYKNRVFRKQYRDAGLALVQQPQYRWSAIGVAFNEAIESVFNAQPIEPSIEVAV